MHLVYMIYIRKYMKTVTWVNMKMTEDGRYPNTEQIKASREIIKIAEILTVQKLMDLILV